MTVSARPEEWNSGFLEKPMGGFFMYPEDDGYSSGLETRVLIERQGGSLGKEQCYRMTVSQLYSKDLGRYQSYGIEILCDVSREKAAFYDISSDAGAVLTLFLQCAEGEVSCDQLLDVTEDFLGRWYGMK